MASTEIDEVRVRLNRRGRRLTPQRAAILDILRRSRSHPTAEALHAEVQKQLPRISLGTVYRNLQVLVEEGWATRLPAAGGSHRYDGTVEDHHHAICRTCGRIVDVHLPVDPSLVGRVEKESGLTVLSFRMEFEGICERCTRG